MKEQFLFYDEQYGVITTKHEEYLTEKRQYNKAKNYQVFVATLSGVLSFVSVLVLFLGIYSTVFNSFKIVGLVFLGFGWLFAVLTIFLEYYIKSKNYVDHFRLTKEYKDQINNR